MYNYQQTNTNLSAGAKNEHPPSRSSNAKELNNAQRPQINTNAQTPLNASEQANKLKTLVTAAQNGDTVALEKLCIFYEPLFKKEIRREIFYNSIGFDEGLSLARLKFIEIVLGYNGTDYVHFAGYVRCRIHFALYDEMKKVWERQNNEAALPAEDGEANISALGEDIIEREELAILLELALKKLSEKQRKTIKALYFEGYTGKELAAKQKITPAMVSKNHKQALNNLKQNIA